MIIRVDIRFDEDGDDREFKADLLAVPRVGEFVSIGSLGKTQRFEVQQVWHHHLDDASGVTLFCRKLAEIGHPTGTSDLDTSQLQPVKAASTELANDG